MASDFRIIRMAPYCLLSDFSMYNQNNLNPKLLSVCSVLLSYPTIEQMIKKKDNIKLQQFLTHFAYAITL